MESRAQCPFCSLYFNVGMPFTEHLKTHQLDQLIDALINMTTPNQQSGSDQIVDPIASQHSQRPSIGYYSPSPQQTPRQVVIVNGSQELQNRSPITARQQQQQQQELVESVELPEEGWFNCKRTWPTFRGGSVSLIVLIGLYLFSLLFLANILFSS